MGRGWILTRRYVLISVKASFAPCRKDCCSLSTQSSSPISSSRRQAASAFSSSVSQVVVRGKLGRTKMAITATAIVTAPSMMNSQRLEKLEKACTKPEHSSYQARKPSLLSMPLVIPAAMRPEKAPERSEPEYRAAVRKPSSLRVYQALKKYKHPGYTTISHRTSSQVQTEKHTK